VSEIVQSFRPSPVNQVRFSVAAHAAWAPGRETPDAWLAWAQGADQGATDTDTGHAEPALQAMPPMLRRRASPAGKMALQAAYATYPAGTATTPAAAPASFDSSAPGADNNSEFKAELALQDIPAIFCSRHGECGRSADLLIDLARQLPLSPTAFSLSVHNATGGLFSIARHDHANSLALAAGHSTVEHAVIEACSLLADGAPAVLLVAADGPLPAMYQQFSACDEQSFGWAWLLQKPGDADSGANTDPDADTISLRWSSSVEDPANTGDDDQPHRDHRDHPDGLGATEPGALQIMRFFLRGDPSLQRHADRRLWTWSLNA
jgi:hypothetical protein